MTFTTFVLMCHVAMPTKCIQLRDVRGPYETKQECVERVDEMAEDIAKGLPMYRVTKYKCVQEGVAT